MASVTVSKGNLPATSRVYTAVDAIRVVIDGFLEGTLIDRIGFFIVWLALVRNVVLIDNAVGNVGGDFLFLWWVGGFGDLRDFRDFRDLRDFWWRRGDFGSPSLTLLMASAVPLFNKGVDFLQSVQ